MDKRLVLILQLIVQCFLTVAFFCSWVSISNGDPVFDINTQLFQVSNLQLFQVSINYPLPEAKVVATGYVMEPMTTFDATATLEDFSKKACDPAQAWVAEYLKDTNTCTAANATMFLTRASLALFGIAALVNIIGGVRNHLSDHAMCPPGTKLCAGISVVFLLFCFILQLTCGIILKYTFEASTWNFLGPGFYLSTVAIFISYYMGSKAHEDQEYNTFYYNEFKQRSIEKDTQYGTAGAV